MDPRPPPPVTITGGPGWTMDPEPHDSVRGASDGDGSPRPGRGRSATALLLAAALGFATATLLADRRQTALEDAPAGVLSLDLGAQESQLTSDLVDRDGGVAVQVSVVLRNTGPRTVALESVELGATGFAADDVAGRRIAPDNSTSVRLLRKVDCSDLAPLDAVGPLQVRATTGAGTRTTALRMETQGIAFAQAFAADACGFPAPGGALIAIDTQPARVVGDRAEVGFELSNASRAPVVLQSLELSPGLRLVALQEVSGGEVTLPLRLAPGDYDPPTPPMRGRGPARRLVAVVEVADCAALPGRTQDQLHVPLFQATVVDVRGRSDSEGADEAHRRETSGSFGPGHSSWGDPTVVDRLREGACPERESALTTVPPSPG